LDRGIRRQTLKLATRQTIESAPPSAYPDLIASIERSSGCSSLAILGRSNRQASCGRTHGGIVLSGRGLPAISRIQTFWGRRLRYTRARDERGEYAYSRPTCSRPTQDQAWSYRLVCARVDDRSPPSAPRCRSASVNARTPGLDVHNASDWQQASKPLQLHCWRA
jgi:hypothetical protein